MLDEYIDATRLFMPHGPTWLAIDIRGLALDEVEHLWIWAYKPIPVVPGVYNYGPLPPKPPTGGKCHSENSRRISVPRRFLLQPELDGQSDPARVWIRIDISGVNLGGVDFLLIDTDQLDLPGWGR